MASVRLEKHERDEKKEEAPLEKPLVPKMKGFHVIEDKDIKVYKMRWVILIIFVLYSSANFMQFFQYSIISNIVEKYYSVSAWAVKMTSVVFMITFLPLAFPVTYLMEKLDLRTSALIGVLGTAVGSWIKVFSVYSSGFPVTFIGQTVLAFSELFMINLPVKIAAVWFGENEVSTACGIAVYGSQFGLAAGFFLFPLLVKDSDDLEKIGHDFFVMYLAIAILTSVISVAVVVFFRSAPPKPPSKAQALLEVKPLKVSDYLSSIKTMMKNKDFVLLALSNGINNGCFGGFSTLLNTVILYYYPNGEQNPGVVGSVIVVGGMTGNFIFGMIMDKTKKYKEVAFWIYLLASIFMIAYAYSLALPYLIDDLILAFILGFFLLGYTPVGFEFGVELSYPASEVTMSTILNTLTMLLALILTIIYDLALAYYGEFGSNIAASISLFVGTFLTALIKPDLRRQAAQKNGLKC